MEGNNLFLDFSLPMEPKIRKCICGAGLNRFFSNKFSSKDYHTMPIDENIQHFQTRYRNESEQVGSFWNLPNRLL